jgi:predicted ATPase
MLGTEPEAVIWTPDRRLRVFISSTLGELGPERAAVRQAVEQLRLSPIMFEAGARPHPPRALYRSYLAQSDVFLGIYWQRYGWVAPDMTISGLEDEFLLSEGMPRLIYCKRPAPEMDPGLADLLARLQEGDSVSYRPFGTTDELRELVLDDLALMLTERFGSPGSGSPARSEPVALPQPSTVMHGRGEDVATVAELLEAGQRLVTLTGLGGVGKTRLALDLAGRVRNEGRCEVAFVDLSAVTSVDGVIPRIAAVLGAREEGNEETIDALVRRLADQPWLLVLDNFEQVAKAAPSVAALLERVPLLQLLVTSRVLLRLRGEVEHRVRPLEVTDDKQRAPAVTLFEERARAARQDFVVDEGNLEVIEELCQRLDGLPLALELAAPQLRLFTPSQLLGRLEAWLEGEAMQRAYADLPERQRTLRATVDWSWELLSEPARRVFARLAVFTGAFTVDAAVEVCGVDDVDVVSALAELLDHSLISQASRADGQPAFRMLDTIRSQARAKLDEGHELDRTLEALEDHLVRQMMAASVRLHSADQALEVRRLNESVGDLAEVLRWVLERGRSMGPVLGAFSACWVWAQITGHLRRMPDFSHLTRAGSERPAAERAVLCWMTIGRLMTASRFEDIPPFFHAHQDLLAEQLDPPAYGMALVVCSIGTAHSRETLAEGRELLDQGVEVLRQSGYLPGLGYGLSHLGDAKLLSGDAAGAAQAYGEALAIGDRTGDVNLRAEATYHLAALALEEEELDRTATLLRTAARYYVDLDHQDGISRCLAVVAGMRVVQGDLTGAARTCGVVDAVRNPLELRPWPMVGSAARRERASRARSSRPSASALRPWSS